MQKFSFIFATCPFCKPFQIIFQSAGQATLNGCHLGGLSFVPVAPAISWQQICRHLSAALVGNLCFLFQICTWVGCIESSFACSTYPLHCYPHCYFTLTGAIQWEAKRKEDLFPFVPSLHSWGFWWWYHVTKVQQLQHGLKGCCCLLLLVHHTILLCKAMEIEDAIHASTFGDTSIHNCMKTIPTMQPVPFFCWWKAMRSSGKSTSHKTCSHGNLSPIFTSLTKACFSCTASMAYFCSVSTVRVSFWHTVMQQRCTVLTMKLMIIANDEQEQLAIVPPPNITTDTLLDHKSL